MNKYNFFVIGLVCGFCSLVNTHSYAQDSSERLLPEEKKKFAPLIDLPILELPFQTSNSFPTYYSFRQSMLLSYDNAEVLSHTIEQINFEYRWQKMLTTFVVVYFDEYLPLGGSWMHEEWHRAVMSNRKISSYNTVNDVPVGKSLIPVNRVSDEDLIRLKSSNPADLVRLEEAGMEAQTQYNLYSETKAFLKEKDQLRGPADFHFVNLWVNTLNVIGYVNTCSGSQADTSTADQNTADGSNVSARDFAGLDCTAWVYDLYRWREPYTNRGVHPSGVGVNRYITYSMLSSREKSFLSQQASLSFLNLVDPFLFRYNRFRTSVGGENLDWNARLSHELTAFGGTVDVTAWADYLGHNYFAQFHYGFTDSRVAPGLTFAELEKPLPFQKWTYNVTGTLWSQPHLLQTDNSSQDLVEDLNIEFNYRPVGDWQYYFGLEGKNYGWIPGVVALDAQAIFWLGLRSQL